MPYKSDPYKDNSYALWVLTPNHIWQLVAVGSELAMQSEAAYVALDTNVIADVVHIKHVAHGAHDEPS